MFADGRNVQSAAVGTTLGASRKIRMWIPRATSFEVTEKELILPLDDDTTLVIEKEKCLGECDWDRVELFDHGVGVMIGPKKCLRIEACLEVLNDPEEGCSLRYPEAGRMDEETALKAVAPKGVTGSIPVASADSGS